MINIELLFVYCILQFKEDWFSQDDLEDFWTEIHFSGYKLEIIYLYLFIQICGPNQAPTFTNAFNVTKMNIAKVYILLFYL